MSQVGFVYLPDEPPRSDVLVQPEMERWRFSLVGIPPFGRGFSRHRYDHQTIPQHGCARAQGAPSAARRELRAFGDTRLCESHRSEAG